MKQYLSNLLPRLKSFGEKLDRIENFVDKTWSFYDLDDKFYTYRFLRNKTLLISISGDVQEWTWEYLKPDSLYIKHGKDGKMFRHGFVLDGLLILQKEGNNGFPSVFYNEDVIPDGDIHTYLSTLFKTKKNIKPANKDYYFSDTDNTGLRTGSELFDTNFEPVKDGNLDIGDKKIVVSNGVIADIYYEHRYSTDRGEIIVNAKYFDHISYGDRVFLFSSDQNSSTLDLADGRFKLDTAVSGVSVFVTSEGRVIKISEKAVLYAVLFIIAIVILIVSAVIYKWGGNSNSEGTSQSTNFETKPTSDSTALAVDSMPKSKANLVSSAVVDSFATSQSYTVVSEYTVKQKVITLFNYINERKFKDLNQLFAETVLWYDGQTELKNSNVASKIISYWEEQRQSSGVYYKEAELNVVNTSEGFLVKGKVFIAEDMGRYRTPHFNEYNISYGVTSSGQINSVFQEILSSAYNVYAMFNLNSQSSIEEIRQGNNKDDWEKVFKRIQFVAANNPDEAQEYSNAAMELYGITNTVVTDDKTYSLLEFLDVLLKNQGRVTVVEGVTEEANGTTIKVHVQ